MINFNSDPKEATPCSWLPLTEQPNAILVPVEGFCFPKLALPLVWVTPSLQGFLLSLASYSTALQIVLSDRLYVGVSFSIQSDSSQDPGQNKSQGVRHTSQPVITPGNPCASTLKFWSTVTLPAHMTTGANTDWPWSQITSLHTLLENYWNLKANLSFISPFKPFHKLVWSYYLYLKASWKLLTKGMNNAFIARTGILS